MKDVVEFFCAGTPEQKGSTKSFYIKKLKRTVTTSGNRNLKQWELRVANEAQLKGGGFYEDGWLGYKVSLEFLTLRPKSLPKKRTLCIKRPDVDKYLRAILDAITGVLIPDDSQVVEVNAKKRYATKDEQPGVKVRIEKVREGV